MPGVDGAVNVHHTAGPNAESTIHGICSLDGPLLEFLGQPANEANPAPGISLSLVTRRIWKSPSLTTLLAISSDRSRPLSLNSLLWIKDFRAPLGEEIDGEVVAEKLRNFSRSLIESEFHTGLPQPLAI